MFFQEPLSFIQLLHHIFGCGLGGSKGRKTKYIYIYIGWMYILEIFDIYIYPYLDWTACMYRYAKIERRNSSGKRWDHLITKIFCSRVRIIRIVVSLGIFKGMSLGDIGCTCNIFFDGAPKKLSNPKKSIKHWVILYRTLKIRFTIFVQSRIHVGVVDRDDLASVEMRAIKFNLCTRQRLFAPQMHSNYFGIVRYSIFTRIYWQDWFAAFVAAMVYCTDWLNTMPVLFKALYRVGFKKWIYYGDYFLFRTVSNGHQQDTYPLHRVSSAKHIKS